MSAASADAEAFALLSIALVIILVRVYVRWQLVGLKGFQLDDFMMPLTGVSTHVPYFVFQFEKINYFFRLIFAYFSPCS